MAGTHGDLAYALIYTAGVVIHGLGLLLIARRRRLSQKWVVVFSVAYLFAMYPAARWMAELIGRRFDFQALFTADYWTNSKRWSLWGGPLAYLAIVTPLARFVASDWRRVLDMAIVPLPLAMIIAKVACFAKGCCFGRTCSMPWSVIFPEGADAPAGVPIHPTQLYEIIVLAMIVAVFMRIDHDRWRGLMLMWFLAIYGVGRAGAEVFRSVEVIRPRLGPLTMSQWLCGGASIVAVVLLFVWRPRETATDDSTGNLAGVE